MSNGDDTQLLTDHLFRQCAGKMVASLIKKYGYEHIDLVTDAVQDTFESALKTWRFNAPQHPQAWLYKVAHNKTINALKALQRHVMKIPGQANMLDPELPYLEDAEADIQLLEFCCNENLSSKNQIIVTLSIAGGLGPHEIANALNMEAEAVKKSIYRSKQILKNSDYPREGNKTPTLSLHIDKIVQVLYLIFNEGYKTTRHASGINKELCYEAMRLAKLLSQKYPNHHHLMALLALMFFDIARFPARIDDNEHWIALEDHDRSLYHVDFIKEGYHYLHRAQACGQVSTYYIEALISSIHSTAPNFSQTNWAQILDLYNVLGQLKSEDHRIKLNAIIVRSHIKASPDLIDELDLLEKAYLLNEDYTFIVAKAYILDKCGFHQAALKSYQQAMALASHKKDIALIKDKIERLMQAGIQNK